MRLMKKETEKSDRKKMNKKTNSAKADSKPPTKPNENFADVQRLVHLLQVHQIELEHQNEELRVAQEELEVSRSKYVNLFDFSPTPYFTLNKEGIIKEVNLNASKMLGVDRNKLIGRRFNSFTPPDENDIFNSFINDIFNSVTKHTCELTIVNKGKQQFNVRLEGLEVEDALETEKKCQVALIDLTEYKRIEGSLKKSNEELIELNATKDKFFSIIAHDLRSPFQSLLGFAEILTTEIDSLSKDDIVYFSKGLNEDLRNLYGLLDNLLHWSMMQRNLLEFNPVEVDLFELVNKTIRLLHQNAVNKNISISNKINPGTFALADIDMVRLVVQNLLINAIKFTKSDGHILVTAVDEKNQIQVSVEDNGMGIDADKVTGMFGLNKMFTTNGTEGEKGTGLGLPLCKEFVERNEGRIWVESKPGKGSKFIFNLKKSI